MPPQIAWVRGGKIHCLHLFDFSPLCVFRCALKLPAGEEVNSHWLHLFDFFPLCVIICVLKLPAPKDPKTHWLHLFWLISTVCSKMSPQVWFTERIRNHIGCICLFVYQLIFFTEFGLLISWICLFCLSAKGKPEHVNICIGLSVCCVSSSQLPRYCCRSNPEQLSWHGGVRQSETLKVASWTHDNLKTTCPRYQIPTM